MPENLPLLYELEITISSSTGNSFRVKSVYKAPDLYPPEPKREGNRIVFSSGHNVFELADFLIPSEVVMEAIPQSTGGLRNLAVPLEKLTSAIFQPSAHNILDELLSRTEDFNQYGPPPKVLGRITFVFDSISPGDAQVLEQVPWELMKWRTAGKEVELRRRCMILRRWPKKSGEKTGGVDLPINVALVDQTPGVPGGIDDLFDHFTSDARTHGGIEWGVLEQGPIKPGEVHHVVIDLSDAESSVRLERDIQSLGGRGIPYKSRAWSVAPRLLILHEVSALQPVHFHARQVHAALASGCDAVLLASLPSLDLQAGNFFPMFYRKLMHNWPLDQCVWAAQAQANTNQMAVDWVFAARQDGEFGLLLTRAVLEATQPKRAEASPARPRRLRGITRGGKVARVQSLRERTARVADELEDSLRRTAKKKRDIAFNKVAESIKGINFEAELHGVDEIVMSRTWAREAEVEISETETMAERVAAAAPERVQEALVRLTNLWITEDDLPNQPRVITANDYLVVARPYELHLEIGPRRQGAIISERFNEESLKKVFEKVDAVTLDVMFFSTNEDFKLAGEELEVLPDDSLWNFAQPETVNGKKRDLNNEGGRWGRRARLQLPRYGKSNELKIEIRPQASGMRRLRTCIYYNNVLLQSVLLEAQVADEGSEQAVRGFSSTELQITGRTTDYLATVDFALLDELPQPSLNLFTNHDPEGRHWVGVYSDGDTSPFQLQSGDMRAFDKDVLKTRAKRMREIFINIEGQKGSYKLDAPLPLSDDDIKKREGYLRDLAMSGWRLFHQTFIGGSGSVSDSDNAERLGKLRNTIKDSHIISIARCGPDSSTLPWAAVYSNALDLNKEDQISLCDVFKKQLADNKWSGNTLVEKHDLLDDPTRCRSLPECPLKTDKRKMTVCPFGFWGFIHQVEQPLQQVTPTSVDDEPLELKNYNFGQTSFLTRTATKPIGLAVGAYPGIPDAPDHKAEIASLNAISTLHMDYQDDRDQIMSMLTKGGQHFYYFYCHGDLDEQEKIFRLKLGPSPPGKPGYIESADLDPDEIRWQTPNPLFIMNGCETMAVTPDATHGFLNILKTLGASGVVGTEEKVWTQLARPVGLQLLTHLLNGTSVGEAFLEIRKTLLRQYNPLGLMYSYYSPATLHLHDPETCTWCGTHKRAAAGGGAPDG